MRVLCFYLPQFHPIPENDRWWGTGFTEWTNVARAVPLFRGHVQPRLPADLGFYDLRLPEARAAQAALARAHGISGFCYYHYWFNEKQLLERPFLEVLRSGAPSLPFCLCWANESWTRAWDGMSSEVLQRQDYDAYDPERHFRFLREAFADPRYIRVAGRPLFLVYRADEIPRLAEVVRAWRSAAVREGTSEPYLAAVRSHQLRMSPAECIAAGFDAVVDFRPHPSELPDRKLVFAKHAAVRRVERALRAAGLRAVADRLPTYMRFDYRALVRQVLARPPPDVRTFPCVFPNWDNTPRKRAGAVVIQNTDAAAYGEWLREELRRVRAHPEEEQIVFLNAWNEWAEGAYLEPDVRHGRAFLEATRKAISEAELG